MKRFVSMTLISVFIVAATSCGALGIGCLSIKVGLVTDVGGLNHKSFHALANRGQLGEQSQLGVQTSVIESKKQEDYVPNLTTFAQQNYDLVIAVGFLMTNATWTVAKQFPNVKFAIIDGAPATDAANTENLPNVANLFFKEQEAGYLVGVVAATMAKNKVGKATHNTVCSMGGIPIPPVDRYMAGYQDAIKTVSPTTTILIGYSNDFVDQQKGKEVGLNQISKGCDILFQVAGGSGLGYIAAATEKGVYAIGVDVDQIDVAPGTVITSAIKRVDKAGYDTSKAVKDGTFKAGDSSFNATNDGVGYGKLDPVVPADAKAAADKALADIKSGAIKPKTDLTVKP